MLYRPVGQFLQPDCPASFWYLPSPQMGHDASERLGPCLPAAQLMQLLPQLLGQPEWNVPKGQMSRLISGISMLNWASTINQFSTFV